MPLAQTAGRAGVGRKRLTVQEVSENLESGMQHTRRCELRGSCGRGWGGRWQEESGRIAEVGILEGGQGQICLRKLTLWGS